MPGTPHGAARGLDEHFHRQARLGHAVAHQLAAPRPGGEHGEGDAADQQREPAAIGNLGEVGGEIGPVDQEHHGHHRRGQPPFPLPHRQQHHCQQTGVDQHRPGYGNAIGRGQVRRVLEHQHQHDHRDHQRPVDDRDVDLPRFRLVRMTDRKARHEAELDRLVRDRERAREITAWLAMNVAHVARIAQREAERLGCQHEELGSGSPRSPPPRRARGSSPPARRS